MPLFNPPAAAGGSALDANGNLVLPAPTAVTTPVAGAIAERTVTRAGFSQLATANVDISDIIMSPGTENYSVAKGESNGGATLTAANCTIQSSGTLNLVTKAYTTYSNSRDSLNNSTATAAASTAILMIQTSSRTRGNAARRGGFYGAVRFMPTLLAGHQAAVGFMQNAGILQGEPSAETGGYIGMTCDSAEANWQIFTKPNGTAGTKIDTGLAKIATGAMLALYLYSAPFGSGIQYQLENEETQATIASGTMTLTLPANTLSFPVLGVRTRNGATTTAAQIAVYGIYSGSRYN